MKGTEIAKIIYNVRKENKIQNSIEFMNDCHNFVIYPLGQTKLYFQEFPFLMYFQVG